MSEAKMVVDGKEIHYVAEGDGREPIDRADQIPAFASEAEEQLWWRTHAFSEEFWREAKQVPPGMLPPLRSEEAPASEGPESPPAGSRTGPDRGWIAGMILGGVLTAGAGYLIYELFKERAAAGLLPPIRPPYLSVSATQPGGGVAELEALLRQLPMRVH